MSYVDRMCLRMMVFSLVPLALGGLVAWLLAALLDLPSRLGGQTLFPDLPLKVAMAGAGVSLALSLYQALRLWRWRQGKGASCYVCGCLLGRERDGRYGPYRKCLGCPTNHAVSKGLV
jgi:hypothetical protein